MRLAFVIAVGLFQYLIVVPITFVALCIIMMLTGTKFWGGVVLGAVFTRTIMVPWVRLDPPAVVEPMYYRPPYREL
jgi:hypothetical protein